MNKNFNNSLSSDIQKNIASQLSTQTFSDDEYSEELESSAEAFRRLQEKVQQNKSSISPEEEEEENEDDEEEEEEFHQEEDSLEEDNESKLNFLKTLTKKVGLKTLMATGLSFGSIGAVATLLIGMYRVHYSGEFEFKGIGGEYQSFSFKNMNFTSFNKKGDLELTGMTKENKLTKAYYTLYSDKSYYAVVEDSKKYKNIDDAYKKENLLTPDELREQYPDIEDVEGREKMFQLNPDVLYSLDTYLHKGKAVYPQQFVKPVQYEQNQENFALKQLTDDSGKITAMSQSFNTGKPVKGKEELGVWNYGLASVLRYKEFEVPQREVVNSLGRKIYSTTGGGSSEVSQTHVNKVPSGQTPSNVSQAGTFDKGLRDKPAYAIDKAVTAGGTIISEITQRWQEKSGSRETYEVVSYITEQEPYKVTVPTYDINGVENGTTTETRYKEYTYKVVDTYEKYMEEYLPFYEGDPDTSEITGSRYYRDYIRNYSNYIPTEVPNELDYSIFNKDNEEINTLLYDDENAPVSGPVNTEKQEEDKKEEEKKEEESSLGRNTLRTMLNSRSLSLPPPMEGEERSLADVIQIGAKKDSNAVMASKKYLPLFEKHGKTYGIDPFILIAMASQESGGNPNSSNGYAKGIMQIEHTVKTVTAFNHDTGQVEKVTVNHGNLFDPDYCIKIGAMELAERLEQYKYNILMSIQGYNYGPGGIGSAVMYYLSGGTLPVKHKVDFNAVYQYAEMNHSGWLTALYPGDLPKEQKPAWLKNPNDGKHDARTWYSDQGYKNYGQGGGDCSYVDKIMRFYAGDDKPWVMKPDGTIVTVDGSAGGGFMGSSNAVGAFNSYMTSNWAKFEELKGELYPWSISLDEKLDKEKKGNYDNLNSDELVTRDTSLFSPTITKTDEEIILNMMFALNQGNYLSKYDFMGEAEWKAMYNQLLSSPTGKTWDDKWIGFTPEDVFGKSLEDLGTLFEEGTGVNPTISKPFGKLKNIYSDTEGELPQYNEMNFGMDLSVPPDTNVTALEDGEIISVEKKGKPLSRYGNYVEIKYNSKTSMVIANLKTVDKNIKVGEKVKKGQIIGTTGGESKSYKENDLHISLLYKGNYINPEWIITRDMKGFEDPIQGTNGGVNCGPAVSNSPTVNAVIAEAQKHIGKPYVWGATGPDGFDCSGFMYYIMKTAGLDVTRLTAKDYRKESTEISRDQIQPGDFVFWHSDTGNKHSDVYHVGLFIGNDTVIDCSTDHNGVGTRKLSSLIDKKPSRYFTFGRYAPLAGGSASGASSSGCTVPGQVADNGEYVWPVPSSKNITSKFGPRWGRNHNGIDISAPAGTEVVASRGGKVIKTNDTCPTTGSYGSKCGGEFGNYVYVEHPDGFVSIYPHMKQGSVAVKVGDTVNPGQKVGEIGSSGSSTGNHLHFEIRDKDNKAVDPLTLVSP